uniref:Uncharacterized protein n=1 Tax=Physcomitrium patens TaxID=3218 RepID=A0A7I3ZEL6_PHYPA
MQQAAVISSSALVESQDGIIQHVPVIFMWIIRRNYCCLVTSKPADSQFPPGIQQSVHHSGDYIFECFRSSYH